MPYSMTAFARQSIQTDIGELRCEIRSVNHRYLEPSCRLPDNLRAVEMPVRDLLRKKLNRGKVEVSLHFTSSEAQQGTISINQALVRELVQAMEAVEAEFPPQATTLDSLRLLQWPGVVEKEAADEQQLEQAAVTLVGDALKALIENRQREGQELQKLIEDRLAQIAEQVLLVRDKMPEILQLQREKLAQRLAEFKVELDEQRTEQEMVLLANKADVAEELDRLDTHLAEVKHILAQKGAIGRRLDFMMQELNREANTLSSKSLSSETTQAAVSIKVLIEQMREQIQNIE